MTTYELCIHMGCINQPIRGSQFCYLWSHHPNYSNYLTTINKLRNDFHDSTISQDKFQLFNVDTDGACLYRCMADILWENPQLLQEGRDNDLLLIIETAKHEYQEFMIDTETAMARVIQQRLYKWIVEHAEETIPEFGETLKDLVTNSHNLPNLEMYTILYSIFAGDIDIVTIGNEKIKIPNRWGGAPEKYAFSKIFNITIDVYILQRLVKPTYQIEAGEPFNDDSRYKLVQRFAGDSDTEMSLLLDEGMVGAAHFMLMEKK